MERAVQYTCKRWTCCTRLVGVRRSAPYRNHTPYRNRDGGNGSSAVTYQQQHHLICSLNVRCDWCRTHIRSARTLVMLGKTKPRRARRLGIRLAASALTQPHNSARHSQKPKDSILIARAVGRFRGHKRSYVFLRVRTLPPKA
jgi:hypothetical protein